MQCEPHNLTDRQFSLRQSNIELLRIVAIMIIIAHHCSVHSGFIFAENEFSINRFWVQFIQIGGKIGVNIFVLISGYFLVSANSIKTSKVIKIWVQMFFYSLVIFVVFILSGIEPFGIKELLKNIAPITFSQWWFASTYFVLYLLSPYVNSLLKAFDRKQYKVFLALLFFCWCIIPTFTGQLFESNALLWFVFLYSFAGYFKIYGIKTSLSTIKLLLISLACILLTFSSAICFDIIGTKIHFIGNNTTYFYEMQQLPIVIISVLMFVGFSKMKLRNSKLINDISSATFGVYLIHDHTFVRPFLWQTLFRNKTYSNSSMLIPYSLMSIGVVFVACTIIELLRINLIERNYMALINRVAANIDNKVAIISEKFLRPYDKHEMNMDASDNE